jgi:serine-aspartate repeat-containing protein C/D/E
MPLPLATTQNSAAATDNNSDPNIANGLTEPIAMNPSGSGVSKNNYTIDAGYRVLEIGNYVWIDSDADGVQDNDESGISGVVLDLYSTSGNPIKVCKSIM